MQITVERQPAGQVEADALIVPVFEGRRDARFGAADLCDSGEVAGKPLELTLLHHAPGVRGTRVIYETVWPAHRKLCEHAGVGTGSTVTPRIHDHRHTFAVKTLLGWYQDGVVVPSRISWLSTYLGHREPRYTYHYLSAAPDLLAHAARLLNDAQAVRS